MNNRYPLRNIPIRSQDYTRPAVAQVMDLLNAWLPPTPMTSPDEMVIQQRGRRRSPTKQCKLPATSFNTDFQSFESLTPSTTVPLTPTDESTPTRASDLFSVRKRLMMTPEVEHRDPLSKDFTSPCSPYKQAKREIRPRRTRSNLKLELSALSNQQLINVITNVAEKYSLQREVRSSLPSPDVAPLITNLEFFSRNIRRSLPTSRLMYDVGCYRRVKTHIDNFKQACIDQGRQLEQSCAWRALESYVKQAWTVVQRLPVWSHGNQNKARLACFRALTTMMKMVVISGEFCQMELDQLTKWCVEKRCDFPPLGSVIKLIQEKDCKS